MTQETIINGIGFTETKSDYYGNPRYIVHFLDFLREGEDYGSINANYAVAKKRAKECGFKVYRGNDYGGGFVVQSYNIKEDARNILKARGEL